jgi:hypothetical protein
MIDILDVQALAFGPYFPKQLVERSYYYLNGSLGDGMHSCPLRIFLSVEWKSHLKYPE